MTIQEILKKNPTIRLYRGIRWLRRESDGEYIVEKQDVGGKDIIPLIRTYEESEAIKVLLNES